MARDLPERLLAVAGEATALGRPDLVERCVGLADRHGSGESRVLVVGDFKRGKSSLVNALTESRCCPADPVFASALPVVVRYGPVAAAQAITSQQSPQRAQPVPLAAVAEMASDRGDPRLCDGVLQVEVECPSQQLSEGLTFVDMPALAAGLASPVAAGVLSAVVEADGVILVTDAAQELTAAEIALLQEIVMRCRQVVCVLTKVDFYPHWREVADADRTHLLRHQLPLSLFPLSVPLLEAGRPTEAGVEPLSEWLTRDVLAARGDRLRRASEALLADAVNQLRAPLAAELAALEDPAAGEAMRARLAEAGAEAEAARSTAARWQQLLADRFADMVSNVDLDLGVRLRAVRKEATDAIDSGDPAQAWPEITRRLRTQTTQELAAHQDRMRAESDQVVAEVSAHFGAAEEAVTFSVGPAQAGPTDQALDSTTFGRMSRRDVALSAARGASGGVAVTAFAGHLATVVVPFLTPISLGAAYLFVRKTARDVREGHLRVQRATALRAVAVYLDEVELLARKESRDALRRLNMQLRDHFEARARELAERATQTLQGLARSLDADRSHAADRATELRESLARLDVAGAAA